MKEKWMAPKTVIEEFTPDNYCRICWGVACDVDAANKVDEGTGVSHNKANCGQMTNQVIIDFNNDQIPDLMRETKTQGLGDLTCYIMNKPLKDVKVGDYIEWETRADTRVWHHQGRVEATFPGRPNMS